MVHENFRFQTPILAVREVLARGTIGRPFFARISWRTGYDVYASQPYLAAEERFIILDLVIHLLDVARCLFGEVERVVLPDRERPARHPGRGLRDAAARAPKRRDLRGRCHLPGATGAGPVPRDH